jgi:hypothetical protein
MSDQVTPSQLGPCAKATIRCTLVTAAGEHIVGENWCRNPQPVCPRLPGEDYTKCSTVCDQEGHAEQVAARLAGEKARGAHAYIEGHTYACRPCQEDLYGAGVRAISVGIKPPPTKRESAYREIADQMGYGRSHGLYCLCSECVRGPGS